MQDVFSLSISMNTDDNSTEEALLKREFARTLQPHQVNVT